MKHIIVMFSLFDAKQKIYVYDKGVCLFQTTANAGEIIDTVRSLANKYEIEIIDIYGDVEYCSKYKKDMLAQYTNIKEINLIQG